jgi:hypothetical protein
MKAIKFSLNEAMLQIQSSIFTLSNNNLTDFQPEDNSILATNGSKPLPVATVGNSDDVFFIMQNVYIDLLTALLKSETYYI